MPTSRREQPSRTALLVMRIGEEVTLCPFFGKCDGVVVIDPDVGRREYRWQDRETADAMCDLIIGTGARRLILGFVGEAAADRLRRLGIDVRVGPCACALDDLVASFDHLPSA